MPLSFPSYTSSTMIPVHVPCHSNRSIEYNVGYGIVTGSLTLIGNRDIPCHSNGTVTVEAPTNSYTLQSGRCPQPNRTIFLTVRKARDRYVLKH